MRPALDDAMLGAVKTLACIQLDLGRAEEAIELFEEIESASADTDAPLRPLDGTRVRNHATCLIELGRYDEAESRLRAIDDPTPDVLDCLVTLYEAWGKPARAARYREMLAESVAKSARE
jgi:tetratricopeptide (TPR) repeat protein